MTLTAAEIVAIVKGAGGSVETVAGNRIRVQAPASLLSDVLKAAVVEHKPELLRLLGAIDRANDVARSARLLRECRWDPLPAPCTFHVGPAAEACRRCSAPIAEHYRAN